MDLAHSQSGLILLLNVAIKGLVVLALAGAIAGLLRHRSAALRHMIWSLAAGSLLALPLLCALLPQAQLPLLPTAMAAPDAPPAIHERAATAAEGVAAAVSADARSTDWPTWIIIGWLIGVLIAALPLLLAYVGLHIRAARATAVTEASWLACAEEIRLRLGIGRRVIMRWTPESRIPVTYGLLRPVILLPQQARQWDAQRRQIVLLHELGHIRRLDHLTQLVLLVVEVVYWFNPLVYVAGRRLRVERERACDDLVLDAGHRPSDYATQLLGIVRSLASAGSSSLVAVAMGRPSQVEERLLAILDAKRDRTRPGRIAGAGLLVAMALLLAPAALVAVGATPAPTQPPETVSTAAARPDAPSTPVAPAGAVILPSATQPAQSCAPVPAGIQMKGTTKTNQEANFHWGPTLAR